MSALKVFGSPEKYVQGPYATVYLGSEMKKLGMQGPVVTVSSGTPRRMLGPTWEKSLTDEGYKYTDMDFGGICTAAEAEKISSAAKSAGA
eukprot:158619_1